MSILLSRVRLALAASLFFASLPFARAQTEADEIRALREQIRLLDEKLRVLERKQELKDEEAATSAKSSARVTVNDRGFTVASGDGAHSLRLRGLVQFDSRSFFDDGGIVNNTFVLRRARTIFEGTFNRNVSFHIVPEFGGSSVSLVDANIGLTLSKAAQLRVGRFKSPVGLELLQSDLWGFFAERSLVTNLVPNRDIGLQLSGERAGGRLNYSVALLNGVADATSSTNADFDEGKDLAARVFAHPFRGDSESLLRGLGVGLSGSYGRQKGTAALTGGYRTDGQQTFFRYRPGTLSDGKTWRVSPQAYYYQGPLGLLSEYVVSTINVRPGAAGAKQELQNKAWQFAAGYVLTGENSSYGGVVPKNNFDLAAGTWGAFEIVARYANLNVDRAAFPLFADPAACAREASSVGVGLNWYLSKTVRATLNYFQTGFDNNVATPSAPLLRQDEKVFISRLQLTF